MSPSINDDPNNVQKQRPESPAEKALRKWKYARKERRRWEAAAERSRVKRDKAIKDKAATTDPGEKFLLQYRIDNEQSSMNSSKLLAKDWGIDEDYWKAIWDGLLGRNESTNNAPSQEQMPSPFQQQQPVTPATSPGLKSEIAVPAVVQPTTPLYGQPAIAGQSNSLLVTRNDAAPVNSIVSPAPAVPDYEAEDARQQKMLDGLYPSMGKLKLPPLVRRDGQELSTAEKMYPAMGYNEDEYEPWSDDAVAMAITKYPDVAKNESVARRLAAADPSPQPEAVEEEYRLPLNPTLTDLARHEQSKRKKLW
jgi:hypothetical protein